MTGSGKFSDEQLTAFLDGEIDAQTARDIKKSLEDDEDLKARLAALSLPIDDLKAAFGGLLGAAPVGPDLSQSTKPRAPATRKLAVMAIAASVVLGIAIGMVLQTAQTKPSGWKEYAAAYHSLYVTRTLSAVETSSEDKLRLLASLGEVLGYDLSPAQTDDTLVFKRGQLLGYQGTALVQLAYLTPGGAPVALCITRSAGARDMPVTPTELEGMAAAEWSQDGLEFLLIGGTDAGLIKDAADRLALVMHAKGNG